MRKIVDYIDISEEDMKKYIEISLEFSSVSSSMNTLLSVKPEIELNKDVLDNLVDNVIARLEKVTKKHEEFRLYLVDTYIKPEYQTEEYSWNIDTGRQVIEISKDE